MRVIDLSRPIASGMEVYSGDPPVSIGQIRTVDADGWSVSRVCFGTHTATHVDAFCHVTVDSASIDQLPLTRCFGSAIRVAPDTALPPNIGLIFDHPPAVDRLEAVLDADPPFIGAPSLDIAVERPLLRSGIVTYDGLIDVEHIPLERPFTFYGFPLRIIDGDGSPVRAVAVVED